MGAGLRIPWEFTIAVSASMTHKKVCYCICCTMDGWVFTHGTIDSSMLPTIPGNVQMKSVFISCSCARDGYSDGIGLQFKCKLGVR